jgi:hypothetical protein
MESMGKKPRRRRSFTSEFKTEIVELCQRGDRSAGQVEGFRPDRPRCGSGSSRPNGMRVPGRTGA